MKKYLQICVSICEFFLKDLSLLQGKNKDDLCISYTPLKKTFVHNASLMGAEFIARVGNEVGKSSYINISKRVANYSINQQHSNGAYSYFGNEDSSIKRSRPNIMTIFDHYHTGFIVRSLLLLGTYLNDSKIKSSANKVAKFYISSFFDSRGLPKILPDRRYPVNIHSCSESILCLSSIQEYLPEYSKQVNSLLPLNIRWILKNMWVPKKNFLDI